MRRSAIRSALVTGAVALTVLAVAAGSVAATSPSTSPSAPTSSGTSSGSSAPTDLSEPQTSSEGVDVQTLGTVTVRPYQTASNPAVVMALHGVQRVDGATVVYFSAGYADGEVDPAGLSEISAPGETTGRYTSGGAIGSVRLVDLAGGQAYRTVVRPSSLDGAVNQPFGSDQAAFPEEAGVMGVMYAVLPELPASVDQVDVDLLWGVTIPGVTVQDGYLEPATDPETVIPLGTGWPAIDAGEVADMGDPQEWTFPLSTVVEALDASQVVTEEGETVTIDLAADVLFAFDRADLSPAAQAKLAEITQKLITDNASGAVTIVGHTDSEGSDAYNIDLSSRRAQSVADVLTPALAGQSLTFGVDGRGEAEPVADNDSEEGRQANRRVTITYTTEGG